MGMFDTIRLNRRMPDGYFAKSLQTKDLDCSLDEYEITPDDRLVRTYRFADNGKHEAPPVPVTFSGIMYAYEYDTSGKRPEWHAYYLVFEQGVLVSVQLSS